MKKILFTLTILLFTTGSLMAQEITNPELKKFVEELKNPGYSSHNESNDEEKGIYRINSVDEESYKSFCAIIEKYDIYFAEEIFGMELQLNVRDSGTQIIMFQGDTYGLAIADYAHSQRLTISIVKGSVVKLYFEINEAYIAEERSQKVYFNNRDGDVHIESETICFEETPELIDISDAESILPSDITMELLNHYMPMLRELEKDANGTSKEQLKEIKAKTDSIRQACKDEIILINHWIEQRIAPGEIKIPSTGSEFIVIPKNAKSGIYEWINSIGFCRTEGQEYNVLTATEIVALYTAKKKEPNIGWNIEGYSNEMRALFANEVPGNEPAYLYRRSTTAEGYDTMKHDLMKFFDLGGNGKSNTYKGFRTIERIDTDEYCFLHLYNGNTTILIYDSPIDKHCQMDIIVGGIETFNDAVNDISINGKKGVAKTENIIISDGDIKSINGEVEINGVTYNSGVHFTTGYMKNLK